MGRAQHDQGEGEPSGEGITREPPVQVGEDRCDQHERRGPPGRWRPPFPRGRPSQAAPTGTATRAERAGAPRTPTPANPSSTSACPYHACDPPRSDARVGNNLARIDCDPRRFRPVYCSRWVAVNSQVWTNVKQAERVVFPGVLGWSHKLVTRECCDPRDPRVIHVVQMVVEGRAERAAECGVPNIRGGLLPEPVAPPLPGKVPA